MHQSISATSYPCKPGVTAYTGEQTVSNNTVMNIFCICPQIPILQKKIAYFYTGYYHQTRCLSSSVSEFTEQFAAPLLLFSRLEGMLLV
jgi:hypothetical protein